MIRRSALYAVALMMGACDVPGQTPADGGIDAGPGATLLTLLFTGDVRGNIEPCG